MLEQLVTDDFFVIDFGILHSLINQRVGILTLPFIFDIPGEMVYAGAGIGNLIVWCADPVGQHCGCALYTMAKPREPDERFALHCATQH